MMQLKKWKALLLAGVMTMSMGMTAFAEDTSVPTIGSGSEGSDATVSVTKNLEFAEGITVPTAEFEFVITPVTTDAPAVTIGAIKYSSADEKGELTDGKYSISKTSKITFETFPHAGEYVYTVKETPDTYNAGTNENMAYDAEEYKMHVYVANGTNGKLYVKEITASDEAGAKVGNLLFTNTYTKKGNGEDSSLVISKSTVGALADKTKDFTFKITFTKAATEADDAVSYTGKIGTDEVACTIGKATEFQLHDGESLVFDNLPAGTRYVVEEVGVEDDGYTPSIAVVENGTKTTDATATNEARGIASAEDGKTNLVGEGANSAAFTNTYKEVAITGVVLNNLPFIILIAAVVCAFAALTAAKRRRNCR